MSSVTKIIIGALTGVALIACAMFGIPAYNVWQQEMEGKAELAKAEQNRQILIQEANAKKEAAVLDAEAEFIRARGMAKSIEVENGKLTDRYIQYLWVRNQTDLNNKTIIYIPTEANLPILEANRNN